MKAISAEWVLELAHRDGWYPDKTCGCIEPKPVGVVGNGYAIAPWMCAICRRAVEK